MWFHRDRRSLSGCPACGCDRYEGEHLLGPQKGGTYRIRTQKCPKYLASDPLVAEALSWHAKISHHKQMPRAGGLEDQDAILLDALTTLATEAQAVESALLEAPKHGR